MRGAITRGLKNLFRRYTNVLPGGRRILRYVGHRRLAQMGDEEHAFQHYYDTNARGSTESVSGPGSTIAYTENIRKEIPRLVKDLGIQAIPDVPCGDYNWFRMIQWESAVGYIGGDIVQPLVERNQSLYGSPRRQFIMINIVHDVLPTVDLWLCRNCLMHLSNKDVLLAIDNFLKSDIRYLLTSTFSACTENADIPTGSCRLLNLQLPRFSFPSPIHPMIDDWIEGCDVRRLALWDRETLKSSLASNKALQRTVLTSRR